MNKKSSFSWKEFVLSFIVLAFFGALPGIMYGANLMEYLYPYGLFYLLYWLVVASAFTFLTIYQRRKAFEEPMIILSEATKKVASGDFSVYLKPIVSLDQMNYINQMFLDFNTMVEELGSLETMKTDFIASVSHEIKTPLASIQGYARMLQDISLTSKERIEYTHSLMKASQSLTSLVTSILHLSKLENQGIISSKESYNVCEQISETIVSFIDVWEEKGIQFDIDIEDYATIYADPALVSIIWRNLLSNATKFSSRDDLIRIRQTSTENGIKFIIEDTGIGMSHETQKRLFEKFYQGDHSHSIEGNGLGMALVWRAVELLDGSIEVKSILGKGTVFTVVLGTQLL